jgi:drug/metabolite transporter (DMT)-like permease
MGVAVLLALCSAAAYGLSDFVGGLLSKRASVWAVAAVSQFTAAILSFGLVAVESVGPASDMLRWGVLAGLGSAAGTVFIYRGLAVGRMAVVAPLSAITAAAVPVLTGLLGGEYPGALPIAGIIIALPSIWLVSGGGSGLHDAGRADVVNGLVAGGGFGLQFAALGQVPEDAGLFPLAMSQALSVVFIVGCAAALRERWLPHNRFGGFGVVAGLLSGIATVCFQFAAQQGLLAIAGVLTALYPAVTVLLAGTILRERIDTAQAAGLTFAAVAIALIATG